MKFTWKKTPSFNLMSLSLGLLLVLMLAVVSYAALVQPTGVETAYPSYGQSIKSTASLRSATILTTSYVETNFVQLRAYKSVALLFTLEQGSLTSFQYRVLLSYDGVIWWYEGSESVAAGTITDSDASYTYTFAGNINYYKVVPFHGQYMKLEVKGTGTVTNSSCAVDVMGVY